MHEQSKAKAQSVLLQQLKTLPLEEDDKLTLFLSSEAYKFITVVLRTPLTLSFRNTSDYEYMQITLFWVNPNYLLFFIKIPLPA